MPALRSAKRLSSGPTGAGKMRRNGTIDGTPMSMGIRLPTWRSSDRPCPRQLFHRPRPTSLSETLGRRISAPDRDRNVLTVNASAGAAVVRAFVQLDSPVELRSISKHRLAWRDLARRCNPGMAHPSDRVEQSAAEREPPLLTGIRVVASSVSDRYLRSWYLQRVTELSACGQTSSGEADWEAAK
jgi:hypothetical protein